MGFDSLNGMYWAISDPARLTQLTLKLHMTERLSPLKKSIFSVMISVTRLGNFLKFLEINLRSKVAQTYGDF